MSQSVPLKRKHKTSSNDTASAPSHHLVFYDAYESYSIQAELLIEIKMNISLALLSQVI